MAILQDDQETRDGAVQSEILERLSFLELQVDELALELESMRLDSLMQNRRIDILLETQRSCWQQKLVFKDKRIRSERVWRGSVDHVFAAMTRDLIVDENAYVGTTWDPDRRIKEHASKTIFSPDQAKPRQPRFRMDVLYHTTCSGKAADMENRLLWKYPLSRNAISRANGIVFGKPSYFVYLLRILRQGKRI